MIIYKPTPSWNCSIIHRYPLSPWRTSPIRETKIGHWKNRWKTLESEFTASQMFVYVCNKIGHETWSNLFKFFFTNSAIWVNSVMWWLEHFVDSMEGDQQIEKGGCQRNLWIINVFLIVYYWTQQNIETVVVYNL